jgi:hypothetical protein
MTHIRIQKCIACHCKKPVIEFHTGHQAVSTCAECRQSPEYIKRQANGMVSRALSKGIIVKPEHCELCGASARSYWTYIVAHHQDYSKPLDVIWCCGTCHHRIHGKGLFSILHLKAVQS